MSEGGGCRCRIRHPRRSEPADLRRPLRRGHPQHPVPARAGRGPRCRGLREGVGPCRSGARHLGPGRDQPGHADRRRDAGLRADRVHHGSGQDRPDRDRRLPGGRRDRHHDAGRQALLPGAGPARDPAHDPRGIPRRPHRAARPGAGGRAAGPVARRHPVRPERGAEGRPARLQELRRGQRQADPPRREGAGQLQAPDPLRRRRCRQRQRRGGAAPSSRQRAASR